MKFVVNKQVFLLLILLFVNLQSQTKQLHTISGIVISKETGDPLSYVNVFLDATTLGTTTNNYGEYEISRVPTGSYRIIASMIGYERKDRNIQLTNKDTIKINFQLATYSYKLDEINVTTKRDYNWIDDASLFKKQFLGTSENSSECKIVNLEVLEFTKTQNIKLKAEASEPIEVVNKALGYKVFFDLKEFVLRNNKEFNYYGNIRFVELIPKSSEQKNEWIENREKAFNGSFRHFLISLYKNKLSENGFYTYIVNDPNWENLRRRDFLSPNISEVVERVSTIERVMQFDNNIMVTYQDEWEENGFQTYRNYMGSNIYRELNFQTSWINLPYGFVGFDINGNLMTDYKNIKLFGYWAWQRVANLLPTNYIP